MKNRYLFRVVSTPFMGAAKKVSAGKHDGLAYTSFIREVGSLEEVESIARKWKSHKTRVQVYQLVGEL